MNKLQIKEIKNELIQFAKGHEDTDEFLILSYNKAFNKSVIELGENEFKELSYAANYILTERQRKKDAIAEFVTKSQHLIFYNELINTKGFFFALFVKLMADISNTKFIV